MTVKCEQEKCSGQGQDEQFYCGKCNMELCSICRFEHMSGTTISGLHCNEEVLRGSREELVLELREETTKLMYELQKDPFDISSQCPNCKTELLQIPLEDKGIVKILQLQCPKCNLLTMYNVVSFDCKEYIISIPSKEK